MNRRDAIRLLGAGVSVPLLSSLTAEEAFSFGRTVHSHLSVGSSSGRWIFKTLDSHQNETVTLMADLIIPETDTPGAKAARVNEFIDLILTEWYDDRDRDRFLKGLVDVDERCRKLYKKEFADCAERQQAEILKTLDEEATAVREAKSRGMNWGREVPPEEHFFQMMKWLTLVGYYTSEIGLRQELKYQVIPGRYAGCILTEASTPVPEKSH